MLARYQPRECKPIIYVIGASDAARRRSPFTTGASDALALRLGGRRPVGHATARDGRHRSAWLLTRGVNAERWHEQAEGGYRRQERVTVLTVPAQHRPEDAAAFLERQECAPQDAQLDVRLIRWGQRRATMQRRERWQARRARLADEAARRANAGRDTLAALRSQKPIAAARPDAFPCVRFENPPDYGQIARGCHAYVDIVMKPI